MSDAEAIANLLVRWYWRKGRYGRAARLWLKLRAIELLCWALGVAQRIVGYEP